MTTTTPPVPAAHKLRSRYRSAWNCQDCPQGDAGSSAEARGGAGHVQETGHTVDTFRGIHETLIALPADVTEAGRG